MVLAKLLRVLHQQGMVDALMQSAWGSSDRRVTGVDLRLLNASSKTHHLFLFGVDHASISAARPPGSAAPADLSVVVAADQEFLPWE